ncbi:hypothetical protein KFL_000380030 [Klebsormidium nitens]|uniref:Uncharacterized protein n=1 Tax=Klebsormidium nitens TaxID=105231 RepID=A0A1Y1HMD3_KLENI|nr:hypothetical protein KFL_000380030 [Klebsormidium nitens]|eukprot:GAQ79770.1 hypothetical protein KFL_000380030 [Klebsormidium nitens]
MGSSLAVAGGPAAGPHEAHKLHILAHTARPLPSPHSPTRVTRAFGKLNFHKIAELLHSSDLAVRQKATKAASELLATAESRAECLAIPGVTGTLAGALVDGDLVVRQQAAQCMVHIAGSQKGCADLCDNGVVLKLVAMLTDDDGKIRTTAFEALAAASSQPRVREILIGGGWLVGLLVQRAGVESGERARHAVEILVQCAQHATQGDAAREQTLAAKGVPVAVKLLGSPDAALRETAARLVAQLGVSEGGKAACVAGGAMPPLVVALQDSSVRMRTAAASALMSLTVPLVGKEAFVAAGGLAHLPPLLDDKQGTLCLHTLQLIANLAELPAARAGLRGALPVLERIAAGSGSGIHKRFAAQAVQQVTFQHAG